METESYLNLGSEQFNSWINEFDNKYTKIEKNFETVSKNSESEVAIESSESEDEEDSSIFVKKIYLNQIYLRTKKLKNLVLVQKLKILLHQIEDFFLIESEQKFLHQSLKV